jgi:hypothetical protein
MRCTPRGALGTLIKFRKREEPLEDLWPDQWKKEYNPTFLELQRTISTLEKCRDKLINELAGAGVHSEFAIRDKLNRCDFMMSTLMEYLVVD